MITLFASLEEEENEIKEITYHAVKLN